MNLIETISWAAVELKGAKPDLQAIGRALDEALVKAARLEIQHEVRTDNLLRLARAVGGPNE